MPRRHKPSSPQKQSSHCGWSTTSLAALVSTWPLTGNASWWSTQTGFADGPLVAGVATSAALLGAGLYGFFRPHNTTASTSLEKLSDALYPTHPSIDNSEAVCRFLLETLNADLVCIQVPTAPDGNSCYPTLHISSPARSREWDRTTPLLHVSELPQQSDANALRKAAKTLPQSVRNHSAWIDEIWCFPLRRETEDKLLIVAFDNQSKRAEQPPLWINLVVQLLSQPKTGTTGSISHNDLHQFVEVLTNAAAVKNANGDVLAANAPYRALLSDEDEIEQTQEFYCESNDGFIRDAHEALDESEEELLQGDGAQLDQATINTGNGQQQLQFIGLPLVNDDGQLFASFALNRAELNQETQGRLAQNELIRHALEHCAVGVITLDDQQRIVHINREASLLTGYQHQEAIGHRVDEVLKLFDRQNNHYAKLTHTLQRPQQRLVDTLEHYFVHHRLGQQTPVHVRLETINNKQSQTSGCVISLTDTSRLQQLSQRLHYETTHDTLTGLENRAQFLQRLQRALQSAKAHGHQHCICYIDLDQFKLINDNAGHTAGDSLLKQLGALLSARLRSRDSLCRLGGDEFCLLLEGCSPPDARRIAQELVNSVAQHHFSWRGEPFRVTCSIGVALMTAELNGAEDLLQMADVACQTAKDQGRGQIHVYRDETSEPGQRHSEIKLVSKLREALDNNRFRLFAQPIVPLTPIPGHDGAKRYELLVRMLDPQNNLISPGQFVRAAERYGLMKHLDRWVIHYALEACAELQANGNATQYEFGINVSGPSLGDPAFLQYVQREMQRHGLAGNRICFEVTETESINNMENARTFISTLKARGCTFALDDFGSGLSSFSYLKQLPVDYLKIDGSFVRHMDQNPHDYGIVQAIHGVGKLMNLPTIAEFVERPELVDLLRDMGVDYIQGTMVGEPRPLAELLGASLSPA